MNRILPLKGTYSKSESNEQESQEKERNSLQKGIQLHEEGNYKMATYYFHKASQEGNPVGCYLLAISLRNGWGVKKANSKAAINILYHCIGLILRKLSDYSNEDLGFLESIELEDGNALDGSKAKSSSSLNQQQLSDHFQMQSRVSQMSLIQPDDLASCIQLLPLPFYELGICFYHGWGVKKCVYTASRYYTFAARLNDSDSMEALAQVYLRHSKQFDDAKGKAAFWMRRLQSLGASIPNETWIWKERWTRDDLAKETVIEETSSDSHQAVLKDIIDQYKNLASDIEKNRKKKRLFGLYYS